MNDWIRVKDRLPEIPEDEFKCDSALVLTIDADGEMQLGGMNQWELDDSPEWWTMKYGGTSCDNITHWMPLPEAPK